MPMKFPETALSMILQQSPTTGTPSDNPARCIAISYRRHCCCRRGCHLQAPL